LKHLRAHPAIEPQSFVFFSHGLSWEQHSPSPAACDMSCDIVTAIAARAMPLPIGSAATESATTATKMVRMKVMA